MAAALNALRSASTRPGLGGDRQVRQPDTWLLRRCWQALGQAGAIDETFTVLGLVERAEPQALFRALPLLAEKTAEDVGAAIALSSKLRALRFLVARPPGHASPEWTERLLSLACAAALTGDAAYAFACLERLDQSPGVWRTALERSDLRDLLGRTVGAVGLHPLTRQLLDTAVRRYEDPGAQFVKSVALLAAEAIRADRRTGANQRLLQRCVDAFRQATITSLPIRRHAATTFALAGDVDAALEQLSIIANVQEAQRSSGLYIPRDVEETLLRQVRRPRANADVDFQFYTLRDALNQLPADSLNSARVQGFVQQIAGLGARSDGWTAAAAVTVLVRLGAISQAADVIKQLSPRDPTRSEAYRVLVAGLLAAGEPEEAQSYVRKALEWAQSLPERHPERLTIWGLADAYLTHGQPQEALALLSRRRTGGGLSRLLRRFRREEPDEESLRDEALRMRAALLLDTPDARQQASGHLSHIRRWARTLLSGKALAYFYTEHVLQPIVDAGQDRMLWSALPEACRALLGVSGRELPARVEDLMQTVTRRLQMADAQAARAESADAPDPADADGQFVQEARTYAFDFLNQFWQDSAQKGIWQTVYTVGGTLPLVIALAGAPAVVALARATAQEGHSWRPQALVPAPEEAEESEPPGRPRAVERAG